MQVGAHTDGSATKDRFLDDPDLKNGSGCEGNQENFAMLR